MSSRPRPELSRQREPPDSGSTSAAASATSPEAELRKQQMHCSYGSLCEAPSTPAARVLHCVRARDRVCGLYNNAQLPVEPHCGLKSRSARSPYYRNLNPADYDRGGCALLTKL
ncbi:hypothetical protein NDU88_004248 [Pleurodeles waltl]|uniref:Uncharacterized protein n=1 Tax=Pleurodeles waltl TaxID=8319 RepID=A0AAV7VK69_PLEWA|nr:hypothetical protein NDU88_004248 [Pleurodeles waltl]